MDKEEIIRNAFTNLNSPACYSSVNKVFHEANRNDPTITRDDVQKVLEKFKAFTLHRPRRINYKRLRTIPNGYMTDLHADLADFQKVAKYNDGYRYLLVAVDVLSRTVFTAPVKTKTSKDMIKAFDSILAKFPKILTEDITENGIVVIKKPVKPFKVYTDKGWEFESREMKQYFKRLNIDKWATHSQDVKAATAERFIRTIKERLYRYFTAHRTLRWLEPVEKIVHAINHSISSVTRMRPVDVSFDNANEVWEKVYGDIYRDQDRPRRTKFHKNDTVRMDRAKKHFEKSYLPNFTDEVFVVDKIRRSKPQTYQLKDKAGEEILGKFYDVNLTRAPFEAEKKLVIEKVLQTRIRRGVKEYLVHWKGQPAEAATWIRQADLVV